VAKTTCQVCHRLIPLGNSRCREHTPKRVRRNRPSAHARGLGRQYRKARTFILSLSRVCVLCGKQGANSADHILPRIHGGNESVYNLVPAHLSCNSRRGKKDLTLNQVERMRAFQRAYRMQLSQLGNGNVTVL
jgi:5-methylcytosine-specific restriction endonuclease McrA